MFMKAVLDILIGQALRKARTDAGLSQQALAERLLVPQSTVSKLENAERKLRMDEFFSLAESLNLKPQELLGYICDSQAQ